MFVEIFPARERRRIGERRRRVSELERTTRVSTTDLHILEGKLLFLCINPLFSCFLQLEKYHLMCFSCFIVFSFDECNVFVGISLFLGVMCCSIEFHNKKFVFLGGDLVITLFECSSFM